MKKIALLLLMLTSSISYSQITFYRKEENFTRALKEEEEEVQKIKQLTTVFLLPECYTKEAYDAILQKSWKASPYKIISMDELDYADFLSGEYTFAALASHVGTDLKKQIRMWFELNFYLLEPNIEKIKKGYALRKTAFEQESWMRQNFKSYARIPLQVKPEKMAEYTQTYKPGRSFDGWRPATRCCRTGTT
jgi:hypothetical protein